MTNVVGLLDAPVGRLEPQRLVALSRRVKDESLPFWEVSNTSPFYTLSEELWTGR